MTDRPATGPKKERDTGASPVGTGTMGTGTSYVERGAAGMGAAASVGMVVFGLAAHTAPPFFLLSFSGLLLTALAIALSLKEAPYRHQVFGLARPRRRVWTWVVGGGLLGMALAFVLRTTSHQPLLLRGVEPFALTAMAIGASEEILFRGFIQGRFVTLGWGSAVALAALAHTAYKVALFTFPPAGAAVQLGTLAFFTFMAGLLLGFLRHQTGSVLPPLLAHVVFDLLVYGDWAVAPWWIWG